MAQALAAGGKVLLCGNGGSAADCQHMAAELMSRLGYDRVRVLMDKHLGLDPHQLRHSAATHLGEQKVPLQLIMAKTRHRNPRTAMRYTRPGSEAVAEIAGILAPPRRTH